ncbi:MogA/MoaB family molybdenum cofactor biosynthesis protein [Frankia sp. CNm7]|uniref:MogA/MoaB family molybdenum cofactor biosynthesis protein n=1 Tax=Frankia nepalensis TaxID=1836974 RepID=A0A937UTZ1_9ACTN|nr:MogA/MoaB family molybdenum cofactor biosynthesis protein [Frankia nepalensis]MBL7494794.1 MogA/MoaB family molybdenum cofactor biosynthesis protein [Frankia nepalensis]MBL7514332.1 MogA/MoaB family molybdenum cofactor biosynthesis protein [Frankia nepalensis]MBL7517251.1 MogA/MoaB family molybdenum cofactor biosynthesis protein [Frankia nepalensis]MBL7631740.1 MogA/MoaB family molybdenum cofactor biosynthesis protein [Frankia nepalensis]
MSGSAGLPEGARASVVTVSDRAFHGTYADRSGPLLADGLAGLGFLVDAPVVVPDERDQIVAALRAALSAGADLVVTTGGTGLAPRDVTPEATADVVERDVPGLAEALRAAGRAKVPTAVLSRGLAGATGRALVVNLPGSTGGVRDGLEVLGQVVGHALAQLRGAGDHRPAPGQPAAAQPPGRHQPGQHEVRDARP